MEPVIWGFGLFLIGVSLGFAIVGYTNRIPKYSTFAATLLIGVTVVILQAIL